MDATPLTTYRQPALRDEDPSQEPRVRRRLPKKEREKLIVAEAIRFFAEVGFEGQTRALAQRLGVTQPLLYRYFPDKDALIDRVYREVFLGGWDVGWEKALTDRAIPLAERVVQFYLSYTRANFSFERVRLFMFAGLKDQSIANRYMVHVRDNLFLPLCREIRAEAGLSQDAPITPLELELVAGLHGAIGYVGLRRWVYQTQTPEDIDAVISHLVRTYMTGIPESFATFAKAEGRI
jgi:AcrR family transcriptional regulator